MGRRGIETKAPLISLQLVGESLLKQLHYTLNPTPLNPSLRGQQALVPQHLNTGNSNLTGD